MILGTMPTDEQRAALKPYIVVYRLKGLIVARTVGKCNTKFAPRIGQHGDVTRARRSPKA